MMRIALWFGHRQANLAQTWRQANQLEQLAILPAWAATRLVFIILFAICCWWHADCFPDSP